MDTTKKAPGRVHDVKIGDEPIDLSRTYSVASSSYYLFEATGSITGSMNQNAGASEWTALFWNGISQRLLEA